MGNLTAQVESAPRFGGRLGAIAAFRRDRLGFLSRVRRQGGEIARFSLGPIQVLLVSSPRLVREVLIERAASFLVGPPRRDIFDAIMGRALLNSHGSDHQRQRRLVASVFQPRNVSRFVPGMSRRIASMLERWRLRPTIDLRQEMTGLALGIIGEVMCGDRPDGSAQAIPAALRVINDYLNHAVTSLYPLPLHWPSPRNTRLREALAVLRGRIGELVAHRRREGGDHPDVISMLLRASDGDDGFTDLEVRDQAVSFLAAGHETAAGALAWTFYLLGRHREVMEKVRREVLAHAGDRPITFEDLEALPYALQVFKEAMRLYPPGYLLFRTAVEEVSIQGHRVGPGDMVLISPYAMHRSPDLFPQPHAFVPERFAPEREQLLPRFAYLPFGAGPHACIGAHLATLEGHITVASVVQQAGIRVPPGLRPLPEPLFVLTPDRPLPVALEWVKERFHA
jgi:cytochrome P450